MRKSRCTDCGHKVTFHDSIGELERAAETALSVFL
jgi:hypothetical protein